jgi:hypothetical protein
MTGGGDIVGGIGSYPVLANPNYHQPTDFIGDDEFQADSRDREGHRGDARVSGVEPVAAERSQRLRRVRQA